MGGAAGAEIDRADADLGTPDETIVLASSRGQHPDRYLLTVEDVPITRGGLGSTTDPKVSADITYTDLVEGGAVFSVGSVNWCGSLLADGADNNVSRVTENVLRRFST